MVLRASLVLPTRHNPKPWVVVTNAGTDDEWFFSDHATYTDALKGLKECGDCPADVMLRLDDGSLTSEY